jgi:hypothetical protein
MEREKREVEEHFAEITNPISKKKKMFLHTLHQSNIIETGNIESCSTHIDQ